MTKSTYHYHYIIDHVQYTAKEKLSVIQNDCVIVTIFMPPAMNVSLWSLDIPNTKTQKGI